MAVPAARADANVDPTSEVDGCYRTIAAVRPRRTRLPGHAYTSHDGDAAPLMIDQQPWT